MDTRAATFAGLEQYKLSEVRLTGRELGVAIKEEEEIKKRRRWRRKGKVQPHIVVVGYWVGVVLNGLMTDPEPHTWGQERRVWSTARREFVLQGQ